MGRYDNLPRTGALCNLTDLLAVSREKNKGTPAHLRPGKAALKPLLTYSPRTRPRTPGIGMEDAQVSRATQEDRDTRDRWGVKLKSPYLSITQIPEAVAPKDYATCRAIMYRIDRALEIRNRWTAPERNRLRAQYDAWERRASGTDTVFNLEGWKKKPAQDAQAQAARHRNREFAGLIHDIRTTIFPASPSQATGPIALPGTTSRRSNPKQRLIGD